MHTEKKSSTVTKRVRSVQNAGSMPVTTVIFAPNQGRAQGIIVEAALSTFHDSGTGWGTERYFLTLFDDDFFLLTPSP